MVATGCVIANGLLLPAAGAVTAVVPQLASLTTTSGPVVGGERVSLHGNGFAPVTKVVFGGVAGHAVRVTGTHSLSVLVPAHKAGRVDVRVVTAGGESKAVKADRFTYVAAPSVSSVTPVAGAAAGGLRVTVKGRGFAHVKAVLFGKAKATRLHVLSSTTLAVTAPAHAAGIVDVSVTTAYGTSKSVKADHFAYTAGTPPGQPVLPLPPPTTVPPTAPPVPPAGPPVVTTGTVLPPTTQATAYSGTTLGATSGTPPYRWSAHGVPGGLTLSTSGVLAGTTYATAGTKTLRVTVTDAAGLTASGVFTLQVRPRPGIVYGWGSNVNDTLGISAEGGSFLSPVGQSSALVAVSLCSEDTNGFTARDDGSVLGWGKNDSGQVGIGSMDKVITPTLVSAGLGVVSVACGDDTAYALTSSGTVYAWGNGTMGELGTGDTLSASTPVLITSLTDIVAVAAGGHMALALRGDGTVLAWGDNTDGELGAGSAIGTMSDVAVAVTGLTDITSVATNGLFSFAVHRDGTVSGWGIDNPYVYLGDGAQSDQFSPVPIPGLADIVQVATSSGGNSYAVQDDGTLWSWGINGNGELGTGLSTGARTPVKAKATGIAAVGTSSYNAFALTTSGDALAWGYGNGTGHPASGGLNTPTAAPWLSQTVAFALGKVDGFAIRLTPLEE